MLDGFHLGDHVAGFEVLDGGLEDGVVEVGFHLDGFGPRTVRGGFVDEGVDNFLFCCEAAVAVCMLAMVNTSTKAMSE